MILVEREGTITVLPNSVLKLKRSMVGLNFPLRAERAKTELKEPFGPSRARQTVE